MNEDKENSILKAVNEVTNHLKSLACNNLSRDLKNNITHLAGELRRLINNDIFEDGKSNVTSQYKDLDQLKNMKPLNRIQKRNILLQSFVENCTGEINSKKINALAHSIEQIYYTRNLNLITPFAFKRNLVLYSITNSKELTTMNKKWEGCGSSRTLNRAICEPAPPLQCPSADVFNTNNQKLGIHSGRIKEGSKVPISICTSMCHIVPKADIFLQYNSSLGPQNWRKKDSLPAILEKVELFEQKAINEFQRYRGLFIEEILASVIQEHQNNTNYDYGDVAVANKGKVKTCSQCV